HSFKFRNQVHAKNMNRIQHLVSELSLATASRSVTIESGRFERSSEPNAPHAFFSPLHYERNYAYPLIVWLHGPNDDERQLRRIMPLVSMRNYVAVAPRGTCTSDSIAENAEQSRPGFSWTQTADKISQAEQGVFTAIQAAC